MFYAPITICTPDSNEIQNVNVQLNSEFAYIALFAYILQMYSENVKDGCDLFVTQSKIRRIIFSTNKYYIKYLKYIDFKKNILNHVKSIKKFFFKWWINVIPFLLFPHQFLAIYKALFLIANLSLNVSLSCSSKAIAPTTNSHHNCDEIHFCCLVKKTKSDEILLRQLKIKI